MPFVNNDGLKIYYEVEGQGPPLVLLHGTPSSGSGWREYGYVEPLENDYKLILIDARGHGKSDKPHDPESYTMQHRVGDVTAVLDDLNIGSTHCFGFSYGGRAALELAKLAPQRMRSMIVMGIGPRWNNPDFPSQAIKMFEAGPQAMIAAAERAGQPYSEDRKARTLANDHEALIAMFKSPWPDLVADLPNMTMPFLILVGEADRMNPHQWLKEIYQPLPDAIFISLPGLDHGQSWSRSDITLPHIKKFLAEVNA